MSVAHIQNIAGNTHNRYLLPHPMVTPPETMGLISPTSDPLTFIPHDGHWHGSNKHVIIHGLNNTSVYHFDPFTDTFTLGAQLSVGGTRGDLNKAGDRLVLFNDTTITILSFNNLTGSLSLDCSITNFSLTSTSIHNVGEVRWSPDGNYIVAANNRRLHHSNVHILKYDRDLKSLTIVATNTRNHSVKDVAVDWSINDIIVNSGDDLGVRVFQFDRTTNSLTLIQTIAGRWRHYSSKWDTTGNFLVCTNTAFMIVNVFKWTTTLTHVASIDLPSMPGVIFNLAPIGQVSWDKTSRFIFTSCTNSSHSAAAILKFDPITNVLELFKITRLNNGISKFIVNPFNNRVIMLREDTTNPLELYRLNSEIHLLP